MISQQFMMRRAIVFAGIQLALALSVELQLPLNNLLISQENSDCGIDATSDIFLLAAEVMVD